MRHAIFSAALMLAVPVTAATLTVTVRDAAGKPVPNAVVTLTPAGGVKPMPGGTDHQVAQKNIQFDPYVTVVPVGAQVRFPNRDKVRHHVYSFSKPKKFELKLYGQEEQRSVVFDKPGVIALGCNIHDAMRGYVKVVETPYAAKTSAAGSVTLANVPAGAASLNVWHPELRAPGGEVARAVTVPAGGLSEAFNVALRPSGT